MNSKIIKNLSAALVIAGLAVIIGWFIKYSAFGPDVVEMNPTTAICFILSACALWFKNQGFEKKAFICSALVFGIGSIKLLAFAGIDLGIDWFYFKSHLGLLPVDSENRMAPNTTVCFVLLGISLMAMGRSGLVLVKEFLALAVGCVSFLACVGYLYKTKSFYVVSVWIPMAPHTAICFLLSVTAVLMSHPVKLFAVLFDSEARSARMARRFLPVVILLPVLIGWLRLQAEAAGLYSNETGISLSVALTVLLLGAVTLWGIFLLDGHEKALKEINLNLEKKVEVRLEELRKTEDQLRQLQKMDSIGRLAGGVAHDFNNILAVISLYSESIETKNLDAFSQSSLEQIKKAVAKAGSLTKQLLTFSRQQSFQLVSLQLNTLIVDFEKMLLRLVGKTVTIANHLAPDLYPVKADHSQVEQIILNLVVNARDAMPDGGKITIETSNVTLDESYSSLHIDVKPGKYVLLAVTDTGAGMPKDVQKKIFEPFFTTKEVGKGTGLGLATVYGIVKQFGGSIWVYSEPGHGTVFKIYLPLADQLESPASAKATVEIASPANGELILVVEDDADLRFGLSRHLELMGYKVIEAFNGQNALEILRRNPSVNLIVTDAIMPQMTGVELIKTLRSEKINIPAVLLSGYVTENLKGSEQQYVQFLPKPFSMNELTEKIRSALN